MTADTLIVPILGHDKKITSYRIALDHILSNVVETYHPSPAFGCVVFCE